MLTPLINERWNFRLESARAAAAPLAPGAARGAGDRVPGSGDRGSAFTLREMLSRILPTALDGGDCYCVHSTEG